METSEARQGCSENIVNIDQTGYGVRMNAKLLNVRSQPGGLSKSVSQPLGHSDAVDVSTCYELLL
jgi:hypothetical protein